MYLSFGEKKLREICIILFGKSNLIYNFRPNEMLNTKTGKSLEIDIYIKPLKLGLEFQGGQHFTDKQQIFRDELKKRIAKEYNVKIIPVTLFGIKSNIKKLMKIRNTLRVVSEIEMIAIKDILNEVESYQKNVSKKFSKDHSLKKEKPKQRAIKTIKKEVKLAMKSRGTKNK